MIADVTGRNPNVFYELGIAHTVKDFCVILTQNIEDVPFDLRHLHCIIYENSVSGADKLKGDLSKAVLAILEDYNKASKIEMLRQKTDSLILDNKTSISRANLESINERKPRLEVNGIVTDCELFNDPFGVTSRSSYEPSWLKVKIHLDITNKESRNVNIISIDVRIIIMESGLLGWDYEVLDGKKEKIIFPNRLDPEDVLSCDLIYNLRPYGNNAQFAAKLRKIDNDPHSTLIIPIEILDSSGNSISFEYKYDLDLEPIKKLYISELITQNQLDLLRLIQVDK